MENYEKPKKGTIIRNALLGVFGIGTAAGAGTVFEKRELLTPEGVSYSEPEPDIAGEKLGEVPLTNAEKEIPNGTIQSETVE